MDLKDKYGGSRLTKNRPETSTAAGVMSPMGAEKLYFCILPPELIVYNITVSFC